MQKRARVRRVFLTVALAAVLLPASASAQAPAYICQWGTYGHGNGQFYDPLGVAVDGSGRVYVVEAGNNRIQVFGSLPVAATSTSWGRIKALYR